MRHAPFLLLLVACGNSGDTDTDVAGTPGTDIEAELLARLQADFPNYTTWSQAPGWEGIVPTDVGTHDTSVQIFYNDIAMADLVNEQPGATSFKEVFDASGAMWTVHAITLDADFGWYYAIFTPEGAVEDAGDLLACFGCHEGATASGFLTQ